MRKTEKNEKQNKKWGQNEKDRQKERETEGQKDRNEREKLKWKTKDKERKTEIKYRRNENDRIKDHHIHTCCKCCMFISGCGAVSTGALAAAEELLVPELSGVGPSFSLITASPLMMWYRTTSMDSAKCGPYSLGSFFPQSSCTAK